MWISRLWWYYHTFNNLMWLIYIWRKPLLRLFDISTRLSKRRSMVFFRCIPDHYSYFYSSYGVSFGMPQNVFTIYHQCTQVKLWIQFTLITILWCYDWTKRWAALTLLYCGSKYPDHYLISHTSISHNRSNQVWYGRIDWTYLDKHTTCDNV